jgi:hypothetical protein
MEVVGLIIGLLGLAGTIVFGIRSKRVSDAFGKYVSIEKDIERLRKGTKEYEQKAAELEELKTNLYRHKYAPKSKAFAPGDKVKLIKPLESRVWISDHAKVGMTGIVVDYGPGIYEFLVYWSEVDYEGEPIDEHNNRWQPFLVRGEDIERIF